MSKKAKAAAAQLPEQFDTVGMTEEEIVDVICNSLDTVCTALADQGLDTQLITASLFRLFAEHMCESGDRDTYEEVLALALEDQWEEVTIH